MPVKHLVAPAAKVPGTNRRFKGSLSPVVRRMEREGVTPDGIVLTHIKSETRPNVNPKTGELAPTHQQEIDLKSGVQGQVRCGCEHFRYRLAKHSPTLSTPHLFCKHIVKTLQTCERRGEVEITWNGNDILEVTVSGVSFDEALIMRNVEQGGYSDAAAAPAGFSDYDPDYNEYLDALESREIEYVA